MEPDAADILKDLQATLNNELDELSVIFGKSLEPTIKKGVAELGQLLTQVKGTGSNNAQAMATLKNSPEVANDADHILHPLMDLLDGKLSQFSQMCEKTVFKRLLKELWKLVMNTLEKTIVLPPMNEKNVILQNLPNAKIEDVGRLFKNNLSANRLTNLGVIDNISVRAIELDYLKYLLNFDLQVFAIRKESKSPAMCCAGCFAGDDETILPRQWQWTEEDLPGQEHRSAVAAQCPVDVHADHRLADQDIRHQSIEAGSAHPGGWSRGRDLHPGGLVHSSQLR